MLPKDKEMVNDATKMIFVYLQFDFVFLEMIKFTSQVLKLNTCKNNNRNTRSSQLDINSRIRIQRVGGLEVLKK